MKFNFTARFALVICLAFSFLSRQFAVGTTITFSEFPEGTFITTQYNSVGAFFSGTNGGPFITGDTASSTSPVLSGSPTFFGTIVVLFVNPNNPGQHITATNVNFKSGSYDALNTTFIRWFGPNNEPYGSMTNTHLGFETNMIPGTIGGFSFEVSTNEPFGAAIDNLSFDIIVPLPDIGSVTTTLNPAAVVTAGAKWELDAGPLQDSGALVTNVFSGTHLISFTTVPGWQTPSNRFVTVTSNTTTFVSTTYTANPGFVQVFLSPSNVVAGGAQWQLDGGGFLNSGSVLTNVAAGSHTVTFSDVAGWNTPASQLISVTSDATNTVNGIYTVTVKTWNGSASTDWLNPTNWTPFGVPTPKDIVILNNGGTITFSAPVIHDGAFNWSVGTVSGSPNPFTLATNAVMTISPGNFKYLSGIVSNSGLIRLVGDPVLYIYGRLINAPEGVVDSMGADQFQGDGSPNRVIENHGVFRKSGGSDTVIYPTVVFTNTATVDVQTNALFIYVGRHVGGTYQGAGLVRLVNDNIFRGDITSSNLLFQSGTVEASGAMLHGQMTWVTGILNTETNSGFTLANDSTLTLVPGFHKFLAGTITNRGVMRLTGDTALYIYGRLLNTAEGVVDSTGTDSFLGDGSPNRTFENHGLFRKSGGGDTLIYPTVLFTNTATVDIQTNALVVYAGSHTGATYQGAGLLRLVNNNYFVGHITGSNLVFESGSLEASGATLHGGMTWVIGTLNTETNSGFTLANDSTLTLVPGFHKRLAGTITNRGLLRLTGDTTLYIYGRLLNTAEGVVDSTGTDSFLGDGNPNRTLENYGLFRKSGDGESFISADVLFTTPGVLDLQTGLLKIGAPYVGIPVETRIRLTSDTDYGRLSVIGPVNVGGNLIISLQPSFTPDPTNVFHVVSASSRVGAFVVVIGSDLGGGLALNATNFSTGVDLVVGPKAFQPILVTTLLNGGQISFQFLSDSGVNYAVEFNDDLTTTNWLPRANINGDGTLKSFNEPATNRPARFFRVKRY